MQKIQPTVGILALQGGYQAHARVLQHLGVRSCLVRNLVDLAKIDALILPGGESSVCLKLLQSGGLFEQVRHRAVYAGMPCFGTCAGAILLAKTVLSPHQTSLSVIDMTVTRNGYGRQLDSRIVYGQSNLKPDKMEMCFIRAPRFSAFGFDVVVIAEYNGEPVCVGQGVHVAASFHPELTHDDTLHRYFIEKIKANV